MPNVSSTPSSNSVFGMLFTGIATAPTAPPAAPAAKPAKQAPKPQASPAQSTPPATTTTQTSLPAFLRNKPITAAIQPVSRLIKPIDLSVVVFGMALVGVAAFIQQQGSVKDAPAPPAAVAIPVQTPAPPKAPPQVQKTAKPKPEAKPQAPKANPPAAVEANTGPQPKPSIAALQAGLKKLGLYDAQPTGLVDDQTSNAFVLLRYFTRRTVETESDGPGAIQAAEAQAASMLWVLGKFPFGNRLPGWVLAGLTNADVQNITKAFDDNASSGKAIFKISLSKFGFVVHARLQETSGQWLSRCYDYTALFQQFSSIQHHIISRACRDSKGQWTMAAQRPNGP